MSTKRITSLMVAGAILLTGSVTAFGQSEIEDLKAKMRAMEQMMQQMQQKISELEKQKAAPPTTTPPTPVPPGESTTVTLQPQTREIVGRASPIQDRQTMNNQQEAAQRPNDLTLDPKYNGFIPVPNTPGLIRFNAKPRLDAMFDNRNSGNADRFVTAEIPVSGDPNSDRGHGEQFNMTAKGSQLSIDVRAPDMPGDFRFYYNNDFFGGGSGMAYRLKQLYGQLYNVTVGFTFSVFEDPDIWPDTVDYEGPNSALFARQPTARYLWQLDDHWQVNFGIQQPTTDVDDNPLGTAFDGGEANNQAPDGGFNVRWEDKKVGHVQFATIARYLGVKNAGLAGDDNAMGWGINLSAGINLFERDSMQLQVTYGEGIFRFVNDNFENNDVVIDSDGDLTALPYLGLMAGYTHRWSDKWRSTATFGYAQLDNDANQDPFAYHETYYGSLNLIWQLRKRLSVGVEGLYGKKETHNGDTGDVFRAQVGMVYSLFD